MLISLNVSNTPIVLPLGHPVSPHFRHSQFIFSISLSSSLILFIKLNLKLIVLPMLILTGPIFLISHLLPPPSPPFYDLVLTILMLLCALVVVVVDQFFPMFGICYNIFFIIIMKAYMLFFNFLDCLLLLLFNYIVLDFWNKN